MNTCIGIRGSTYRIPGSTYESDPCTGREDPPIGREDPRIEPKDPRIGIRIHVYEPAIPALKCRSAYRCTAPRHKSRDVSLSIERDTNASPLSTGDQQDQAEHSVGYGALTASSVGFYRFAKPTGNPTASVPPTGHRQSWGVSISSAMQRAVSLAHSPVSERYPAV